MTLTLAQKIGTAMITRFLEEPNMGLAEIADKGHLFIVPCWLLEMAVTSTIIDECQIKSCEEIYCTSEVRDEYDRWRKLCKKHVAAYQGTHRDATGRRIASNRLKVCE